MQLRKGFKSDANWYSLEARRILNLEPYEKIDPWKIALELGFKVYTVAELMAIAPQASLASLKIRSSPHFSAMRVKINNETSWIVHNELHGLKRQASNICHELAHAYLMHPMENIIDSFGERPINEEHEEEAKWLGPALLISEQAAIHIVRQGWSIAEASERYMVSEQVVRMRLNVTGASRRVKAA